jgi:hypothetical protein
VYLFEESWKLKDIQTYYVDLPALNSNPNTQWMLEYSFRGERLGCLTLLFLG